MNTARAVMLCAASYMLSREADAIYYNLEASDEERKRARELDKVSHQMAKDAGALDSDTLWHQGVEWVTNADTDKYADD
jgi:hypothetical protein